MGKCISLVEKDADLIKKIEAYQKEKRLPTFVEAVRILLNDALTMKEIMK